MGAGSPANTGEAGAMHRVAFFAGEPAPTGGVLPELFRLAPLLLYLGIRRMRVKKMRLQEREGS
ncbi:inosine/uridine-preferring nucleoside hydrolase [Pseudomonas plecoglossicida]|nr:inosine/uridine-preferring nucleoside hydrolase [Pseudomonas plecoglossicida]